jgi:hypothetical protein
MHTEFLVEKIEGKRRLGRSGSRWERSIEMDHEEIKYEDFDCIKLAQDMDRWRAVMLSAHSKEFIDWTKKNSLLKMGFNPMELDLC